MMILCSQRWVPSQLRLWDPPAHVETGPRYYEDDDICLLIILYSDVGIQDRVVIQELIKTVAQTNNLDSSQKDFKGMCLK